MNPVDVLVVLPCFRWMPGMGDTGGNRILSVSETHVTTSDLVDEGHAYSSYMVHAREAVKDFRWGFMLDLEDPATQGCLRSLYREISGEHAPAESTGEDLVALFVAFSERG